MQCTSRQSHHEKDKPSYLAGLLLISTIAEYSKKIQTALHSLYLPNLSPITPRVSPTCRKYARIKCIVSVHLSKSMPVGFPVTYYWRTPEPLQGLDRGNANARNQIVHTPNHTIKSPIGNFWKVSTHGHMYCVACVQPSDG